MKRVFRYSSLALSILAGIGLTNASTHPAAFGTYSTVVPEDRLFIENGSVLRCDLFFASAQNNGKLVAPKGSRVSQTVPPFVWQYSGLLPVSEYLKTVAIHSVSSEDKERAWQDVQLTFYNGLRAEGAREHEAKVAYAGAYAFAPRWPLVEFIDITVPERDEDSRLYRVEYIAATPKGVSIDEYRTLVDDILANSEAVSLSDIRGVIDAADAVKAEGGGDNSWLQNVWRNEAPEGSKNDAKSLQKADEVTDVSDDGGNNLGMLFLSEKNLMAAKKAEMEKVEAATDEAVTEQTTTEETPNDEAASMLEKTEDTGIAVVAVTPELLEADEMAETTEADDVAQDDEAVVENLGMLFLSEKKLLEAKNAEMEMAKAETEDLEVVSDDATAMVKPADESEVIDLQPLVEIENIETDITSDPSSVSGQLAEADKSVLQEEGTPEAAVTNIEVEGEVVDLDTILIDDQVPEEALVEESAMEKTADVEVKQDWTLMPDGSEVLEITE